MTTTPSTAPSGNQWLKITCNTPSLISEAAADLIGVLSNAGVEQSPDSENGCRISGFFQLDSSSPTDAQIKKLTALVSTRLEELFALYDHHMEAIETTLIDDQDWATSWKQFFNPFAIVPGLVIKPTWEEYVPEKGEHIIEMDPGMAFGTGQHASTKMALSLLTKTFQEMSDKAATILDIGTGTGILAMAGALYGGQQISAIDNDPDAVAAAADNVANNGLTDQIDVSITPLDDIQGQYAIICANIVHDVLVDMADAIRHRSLPGGSLILAGILQGQQEHNIINIYQELGYTLAATEYQDEWVALFFQLP